jgi:hypothetical protein
MNTWIKKHVLKQNMSYVFRPPPRNGVLSEKTVFLKSHYHLFSIQSRHGKEFPGIALTCGRNGPYLVMLAFE